MHSQFIQQFCQWSENDIDQFSEEADYKTVMGVMMVLTEEVRKKAYELQKQKEVIVKVEEEIGVCKENVQRLMQIEHRHEEKRKKYTKQREMIDKKMRELKAQWKRVQLECRDSK